MLSECFRGCVLRDLGSGICTSSILTRASDLCPLHTLYLPLMEVVELSIYVQTLRTNALISDLPEARKSDSKPCTHGSIEHLYKVF